MGRDLPDPSETLDDKAVLRRRSIHGAAWVMGAQAGKFLLRLASTVVLARLLTPAEFGLAAMAAPILLFVTTINDLGFAPAVIQRREITPAQVSALFWINLSLSFALALGLAALSPVAAAIYGEPRVGPLLAVMACLVVLSTVAMTPTALLSRQLQFIPLAVAEVAAAAVSAATTIAAAWHGLSYWSLVVGQLAASLTTVGFVYAFTRWKPRAPSRRADIGGLVRFGTNLTLSNIAGYVGMTADKMIIGAIAGKVQLGLYDRSYNLVVVPLSQLIAPVGRVAVPLLSRIRGDADLYRRTYLNMLRMVLILTMPAMITCVVLAPQFITFALGERWRDAAPMFAWICFGGIFSPIFNTTGWLYITLGRSDRLLRFSAASALISIASFALGIRWGAVGVAAVSALSFVCVQTPLMVYGCTKERPFRLRDVPLAIWPHAIAGLLTGAVLSGVAPFAEGWLTLPAFAGAYLLYAGALALLPGGRDLILVVAAVLRSYRA